jgi:type IV pilus assembly protein PilW
MNETRLMHRALLSARPQAGMSLIDILVGMVIGLIGMVVVLQSFSTFEAQKRSTTVTTDAQESGLMALTTIEREMRLAGYGMYYANQAICTSMRQWANTDVETVPNLLPVSVADGASDASDTVTLTFSTSSFGATPSQIQVDFNGGVPEIVVDNTVNNKVFSMGDYLMVGKPSDPARPCVRLQVSGVRQDPYNPKMLALRIEPGSTAPANPPLDKLKVLLPAGGYSNDPDVAKASVVSNMATMRRVAYSVQLDAARNGTLQSRNITAGSDPVAIADGIVNMQVQYGISATPQTREISSWVNATGVWAAPAIADMGRIKALRVAIVARSQLKEKNVVTGVDMSCNNTSGANANGPCAWRDTTASPAPIIDLSGDPDWQRYRYRVYETIVPLRNVMWQSF